MNFKYSLHRIHEIILLCVFLARNDGEKFEKGVRELFMKLILNFHESNRAQSWISLDDVTGL